MMVYDSLWLTSGNVSKPKAEQIANHGSQVPIAWCARHKAKQLVARLDTTNVINAIKLVEEWQ